MTDVVNIGVALVELEHAERAALRAQAALSSLVQANAAVQADRDAFGVISAQLLALEGEMFAKIVDAINTLPSELAEPIVAQIPVPTPLTVPDAPATAPMTTTPTAGPVSGLGALVLPVWAVVVLAVLLAVVAAAAIVWALKVSIDDITKIILVYRAGNAYADALDRRVTCIRAGGSVADCNAAIVLPPAPTPPAPDQPADPATPWMVGGAVVGVLGLAGLGLWFLERRAHVS